MPEVDAMTVRELIEKLQAEDPDAVVVAEDDGQWYEVRHVNRVYCFQTSGSFNVSYAQNEAEKARAEWNDAWRSFGFKSGPIVLGVEVR